MAHFKPRPLSSFPFEMRKHILASQVDQKLPDDVLNMIKEIFGSEQKKQRKKGIDINLNTHDPRIQWLCDRLIEAGRITPKQSNRQGERGRRSARNALLRETIRVAANTYNLIRGSLPKQQTWCSCGILLDRCNNHNPNRNQAFELRVAHTHDNRY